MTSGHERANKAAQISNGGEGEEEYIENKRVECFIM